MSAREGKRKGYALRLPMVVLMLLLTAGSAAGQEAPARGDGAGDKKLDINLLLPGDGEKIIGDRVDVKFTVTGFRPGDGLLAVHLDQRMLTGEKTFFTFEGVTPGEHQLAVEFRKSRLGFPTVRKVINIVTEAGGEAGVKKVVEAGLGEGVVDSEFLYFRLITVQSKVDEEGMLAVEADFDLKSLLGYAPISVDVSGIMVVDAGGNSYSAPAAADGKGRIVLQSFKEDKFRMIYRLPAPGEGEVLEGVKIIYLTERGTKIIYSIPGEKLSPLPVS